MSTVKLMSFVVLLMAVGGRLAAQTPAPVSAPQELTIPLSEPGKPFTLDARLFNGSITLQGYDGKDILIDVHTEKDDEKDDDNEGGGMKRIGGGSLDFSAEEHDNAVTIHAPMSQKLKGITIKIPQGSTKIVLG